MISHNIMAKMRIVIAALFLGSQSATVLAQPESEDVGIAEEEATPETIDGAQLAEILASVANTAEIQEFVSSLVDVMFQPGEEVVGWNQTGINILEEMVQEDGNPRMLFEPDEELPNVTSLSGQPISFPTGFFEYELRELQNQAADEVAFVQILDGIWLKATYPRSISGKAHCYPSEFSVTLYARDPVEQWDEETLGLTSLFYSLTVAIQGHELCTIYDKTEDGEIISRTFSPEGVTYPALDAESGPMTWISQEEFAAVVTATP